MAADPAPAVVPVGVTPAPAAAPAVVPAAAVVPLSTVWPITTPVTPPAVAQSVQASAAINAATPGTLFAPAPAPVVAPATAQVANRPAGQAPAATTRTGAAPVVRLSGTLDFGLKTPLAKGAWVNEWVAGTRRTVPNDWKLDLS